MYLGFEIGPMRNYRMWEDCSGFQCRQQFGVHYREIGSVCVPVSAGMTFASNGGTERPKNRKLPGGLENPFRRVLITLGNTVDRDGAPGARVNVFLTTKGSSIAIAAGSGGPTMGGPLPWSSHPERRLRAPSTKASYRRREAIDGSAQPRSVKGEY